MAVTLTSGPGNVLSVAASSQTWFLKDPYDFTVTPIFVEAPFSNEFAERDAEFVLLGRTDPVVVTDSVVGLTSGQFVVLTTDQAQGLPGGCTFAALKNMLSRQRVLVLSSPNGAWYVRIRGKRATVLESSTPHAPIRRTTVVFTEVAKP